MSNMTFSPYFNGHLQASSLLQCLGLLTLDTYISQDAVQELKQLFSRLEPSRPAGSDVLDSTVKPSGVRIGFWFELNYKRTFLLPSAYHGRRIDRIRPVGHKVVVMLWSYFGNDAEEATEFRTISFR
jgi:hypothetical protein